MASKGVSSKSVGKEQEKQEQKPPPNRNRYVLVVKACIGSPISRFVGCGSETVVIWYW
jgi:hypothetical protein